MLLQWQRAWKEGPCSISFWPARKYTYIYYYYTVLIYMYLYHIIYRYMHNGLTNGQKNNVEFSL